MVSTPARLWLVLSLFTVTAPAAAQDATEVQEPEDSLIVLVEPEDLPPPGLCRAWFPERPPETQSPPEPCGPLRRDLPEGAILLDGGPGPDGRYADTAPPPPEAETVGRSEPAEVEEAAPWTEPQQPPRVETFPLETPSEPPLEPSEPETAYPEAAPGAETPELAEGRIAPHCREAQMTITIGGRPASGFGSACQRPDGSWELRP